MTSSSGPFSPAREAADLLQASLPDTLRNHFDWPTLTFVDGTFLVDDLRESQSCLLYRVELADTGQPVSLYLLFEYQSSPDPWMRFRLLKYCCRIWEADLRNDPEPSELRPIVLVVFYYGPRDWSHSTGICRSVSRSRAVPGRGFRSSPHELLDQTTLEPEAVAGGVKGRITTFTDDGSV